MAFLVLWAGDPSSDRDRGDIIEALDEGVDVERIVGREVYLPKFLIVRAENRSREDLLFLLTPLYSKTLTDPAGEPLQIKASQFLFDFEAKFPASVLNDVAGSDSYLIPSISLSDITDKAA